jgi:Caudovirus prohead serine protease
MSLQSEFPDRLLTLCDGRPGLRGTLHVEISSPSSAELHSADLSRLGDGERDLLRAAEQRSEGPSERARVSQSQSSALPGEEQPHDAETAPTAGVPAPSLRNTQYATEPAPAPQIENQNSKIQNSTPAILDFISSDETLDRYDEIIVASGWRLENYRRNPVFQNSHQYGDILFTLGKALITEVRTIAARQVLFQRIEFAIEANPIARIAYGLYLPGFLTSLSVGFFPIRWQNADDSGGGVRPPFRRKYLEQELLEVSAVAIPANPNALALALKSGSVEKSDLRETLDLLRSLCGSSGPISPISPIGPIGPIPPLQPTLADYLPLARTLRDLLRR